MSGGHYDYKSLQVGWLADEIDDDAERLSKDRRDDDGYVIKADPPEIIAAMRYCASELRRIGDFAKAIEWYLSGDYGPEAVLKQMERKP